MKLLEVRNVSIGIKRRHNLHKRPKYVTAVNGIDFSIDAGEIIAFVGESGCGKSLTALSIAGLLSSRAKITGGEILYAAGSTGSIINLCTIDEKSLCRMRGKEIAMIFQEPRQSLNPLMKVGDQIAEALKLHGGYKKTANRAARDLLQQLKFPEPEKILNVWPHQLSGGMCQRVMIAIAAMCRPRLLIADEPITALDPANQHHILSLLNHINREFGTAVLFISHDLSVVRHFCSRFLVMYAGNIIEEGPSETIVSAPLHPYTMGLVRAIPRKENRNRPLANIPGKAPSLEDNLPGCLFAPRCLKMRTLKNAHLCTQTFPPWKDLAGNHRVRCFFAEPANG